MITPRRALVRPRVLMAQTGDSLQLELVLQDLMASSKPAYVCLIGPAGSGKTTALEHLASVFEGHEIVLFDEPQPNDLVNLPTSRWIVFTSPTVEDRFPWAHSYQLAPWGQDDCIEYLLAAHKERCGSVMARLRNAPGLALLLGNPQLCRIVLDEIAADDSLSSVRSALLKHIEKRFPSQNDGLIVAEEGFELFLGNSEKAEFATWLHEKESEDSRKLLRHRPVQLMLAVAHVLNRLKKTGCPILEHRFPRELVSEIALEAGRRPLVLDILRRGLKERSQRHAMAASILHASGVQWSPKKRSKLMLTGAYLNGAIWQGLELPGIDLTDADLSNAELQQTNLGESRAVRTNFRHANLSGASLLKFLAVQADLAHADLSRSDSREGFFDGADLEGADFSGANLCGASFAGANLTNACFRDADLREACLTGAVLDDADFSNANLNRAILSDLKLNRATFVQAGFRGARLVKSDLEEMELPKADFRQANLRNALLTGSTMPDACFDGACLVGAGLAEIDWERASLRGADLTGVSFHLGSSRCGRVGSPIASEGTRTGFYTDEFTEQDFKAPEEIRVMPICAVPTSMMSISISLTCVMHSSTLTRKVTSGSAALFWKIAHRN
jgi:uncharacterized protein YjbI with pentapeptide repeats/energy-coupling factor transporter ATP-binding protein EcfA2